MFYIFQSNQKLNTNGFNNFNQKVQRNKIRLKNRLQIYLFGESLFKERLK